MLGIVIPTYNNEKTIERCLKSVQAQTYKDFKCVTIIDGSTDGTLRIAERFCADDNRFEYVYKENRGVTAAVVDGINLFKNYEYITFVDGDDEIKPSHIEKLMQGMLSGADISVSGFIFKNAIDNSELRIPVDLEEGVRRFANEEIFSEDICDRVGGARWNKIFKSELLLKIVPYMDFDIKIGEDTLMTYAAMLLADRIFVVSDCGYVYYNNPDSIMNNAFGSEVDSLLKVISRMEEYIVSLNRNPADVPFFRRLKLNYLRNCVFHTTSALSRDNCAAVGDALTKLYRNKYFIEEARDVETNNRLEKIIVSKIRAGRIKSVIRLLKTIKILRGTW